MRLFADKGGPALPFLTITEAAALARLSPKRLGALTRAGVLVEGVHYTRPRGLRPRFKRDALVAWLDGRDDAMEGNASPTPSTKHPRCKLDLSLL
ncbi:MAG TPA: helix-turn-helix domain-containing protein [Candidatus Acidoferrales bacterium]|nr:helix-turn-helix domain-containing protein [Candidatus Acidoferrales bacterium]